jgi:hypothetical protein
MSPGSLLFFTVLVPAVLAAVTVAVAGWVLRRLGFAGAGPAAVALALGAGTLAAQLSEALPAFPPIDVADRVAWLVGGATVLGLLESTYPGPGWTRWENRLLLAIVVLAAVLGPVLGPEWPQRRALAMQAGLLFFVLFVWASLAGLAARISTAVLGPAVLVVAGSAAAALVLSGSLVLGRIGGGLAAALGAVWVLALWLPDRTLERGGVPVLVLALTALLVEGQVYSFLPRSSALLLGAAPLAAWPTFVGPGRRLAPWQSALAAAVLVLVPCGVAVWQASGAAPSYE